MQPPPLMVPPHGGHQCTACLSTCHALQICEDLQGNALPARVQAVRREYELMVKSKQSGAFFWGPGLMVFSSHKLVSQGVDQNVALRTLPCIQAAELDKRDPSKYAYLGEWRNGWDGEQTLNWDPPRWDGDAQSTGQNPRRAALAVQKVAEEGVMARVGTHAFEVALALCTDPRLLAEGGHDDKENKDDFAKRMVGRMRWDPKVHPHSKTAKVSLVERLLFGQSTVPSYLGKGVLLAPQRRDTYYTEVQAAEGVISKKKKKRVFEAKYCVYSLLGRHCQALQEMHRHYPGVAQPEDYLHFQQLTKKVFGADMQAAASSSNTEQAASSSSFMDLVLPEEVD